MKTVVALALFIVPWLANGATFTIVVADTHKERLELFLNDENGAPFRRLEHLDAWLKRQSRQLRFAMNAGMFEPDLSPVGLFVAGGHELKPLNRAEGRGNFYLKPNGVFLVTEKGARIVDASKYLTVTDKVLLATQSGPLLLERGVISSVLNPMSKSKYIRNGVGVRGSEAIFVISNVPVSLYEFAAYFRDELHCRDALYFDGSVSSLYYPAFSRRDSKVDLGPIIAVVE